MLRLATALIEVDDYGPEGAAGNPAHTSWSSFDDRTFPDLAALNTHLSSFECPPLSEWEHDADEEPGRYDWSYIGDSDGEQNDEGKFIYNVTIHVEDLGVAKPFVLPATPAKEP